MEIKSWTLDNGNGLSAEILNLGGTIKKLVYKGTDVVLGFENLKDYSDNIEYFGALIGRTAGRIKNGEIYLDGKLLKLSVNSKGTTLHGGFESFDKKLWEGKLTEGEEPSLELTHTFSDGEDGYPGNLRMKVTYTLKKDNTLSVKYEGETDKTTLINPTNHAYFNLNGHSSGHIGGHILKLDCDFYQPSLKKGELHSVIDTPYDFLTEKTVSSALSSEHPEVKNVKGIDHIFGVNGIGFRRAGVVKGEKSGITMEIYTDRNGLGVYSAAFIRENLKGKEGAIYNPFHGICFETRNIDCGTNYALCTSGILRAGEKLDTETWYKFI